MLNYSVRSNSGGTDLRLTYESRCSSISAVVEALSPRLLGTAELLAALRPQRNRYWSGAYQWLLGRLAERIPLAALPEVLDWAAAHVQDGADAYEDLFPALVQRGWAHVGDHRLRTGHVGLTRFST